MCVYNSLSLLLSQESREEEEGIDDPGESGETFVRKFRERERERERKRRD